MPHVCKFILMGSHRSRSIPVIRGIKGRRIAEPNKYPVVKHSGSSVAGKRGPPGDGPAGLRIRSNRIPLFISRIQESKGGSVHDPYAILIHCSIEAAFKLFAPSSPVFRKTNPIFSAKAGTTMATFPGIPTNTESRGHTRAIRAGTG